LGTAIGRIFKLKEHNDGKDFKLVILKMKVCILMVGELEEKSSKESQV